jgi:hypothetical protein
VLALPLARLFIQICLKRTAIAPSPAIQSPLLSFLMNVVERLGFFSSASVTKVLRDCSYALRAIA